MILKSALLRQRTASLHAFSLRNKSIPGGGNTSLAMGSPEHVLRARSKLLEAIHLPLDALTLSNQVHGTGVLQVGEESKGKGGQSQDDRLGSADGLITKVKGLAVGVLVADCCCVFISNREGTVVGALHAGWKGTLAGILPTAVESFRTEHQVQPQELVVWISPAISGKNYVVGPEVWEPIREKWGPGDYLLEKPLRVDLPRLNADQARRAGVNAGSIEIAGICTLDSPQCFSHRRGDTPPGRMLGVISPRK